MKLEFVGNLRTKSWAHSALPFCYRHFIRTVWIFVLNSRLYLNCLPNFRFTFDAPRTRRSGTIYPIFKPDLVLIKIIEFGGRLLYTRSLVSFKTFEPDHNTIIKIKPIMKVVQERRHFGSSEEDRKFNQKRGGNFTPFPPLRKFWEKAFRHNKTSKCQNWVKLK